MDEEGKKPESVSAVTVFGWTVFAFALFAGGVILDNQFPGIFTFEFWEARQISEDGTERVSRDPSAVVRNIGLLGISVVALALGIWRSKIAERQAGTANDQFEAANKQFVESQRGQSLDRLERGAELLGKQTEIERIAGLNLLTAAYVPNDFSQATIVGQLLLNFVTGKLPEMSDKEPNADIPTDVRAALAILHGVNAAKFADSPGGTGLRNVDIHGYNFENITFFDVEFSGVQFQRCFCFNARIINCDMSLFRFDHGSLDKCDLTGTVFTGFGFLKSGIVELNISGTAFALDKLPQEFLENSWCWDDDLPKAGLDRDDLIAMRIFDSIHFDSYGTNNRFGYPASGEITGEAKVGIIEAHLAVRQNTHDDTPDAGQ